MIMLGGYMSRKVIILDEFGVRKIYMNDIDLGNIKNIVGDRRHELRKYCLGTVLK